MKRYIVLLTLILAFAGYVFAADNVFKKTFNDLDGNKDGKLDMKELDAAAVEIFKKYDKNGDGFLDKSEFKALKDAKTRFEVLDANKDGKVDMQELREAAAKKFKYYDKNQDGYLDPLEMNPRRMLNVNPLFMIYF